MAERARLTKPPQRETERVRAVVVERPGEPPALRELSRPRPAEGEALVRTLLTGIDGTDEAIVAGEYGEPPEGEDFLILGHECLGEVVEAPAESGLAPGDRVVPLVRHGCGMCPRCAYDAVDLCPTADFVEHGIHGLHGFMRELWTDDPQTLVRAPRGLGNLAVLTEPLSIVVKALEEARHVQRRLPWFEDEGEFRGKRALLAGTGSLGSLGAFLLRDEGMEVWALDRSRDDAYGPRLLSEIGVRHVNAEEGNVLETAEAVGGFDLVIEATGSPRVVFDTVQALDENGLMCVLGVPGEQPSFEVDGAAVMKRLVLKNQVVVGSVNSNRRHFELAFKRLASFRSRWDEKIDDVLSHWFTPEECGEALAYESAEMVKKVMDWRGESPAGSP